MTHERQEENRHERFFDLTDFERALGEAGVPFTPSDGGSRANTELLARGETSEAQNKKNQLEALARSIIRRLFGNTPKALTSALRIQENPEGRRAPRSSNQKVISINYGYNSGPLHGWGDFPTAWAKYLGALQMGNHSEAEIFYENLKAFLDVEKKQNTIDPNT